MYRSHSCTARPAVRQSAPRRSSFAVIAKSSTTVILRESGVSSTPRLCDFIMDASEYWIARFRAFEEYRPHPSRRLLRKLLRMRSEIYSQPPSRAMTVGKRDVLVSQTRLRVLATRSVRGVDETFAQRGRGECRMPVAPAASCALGSGRKHTSNNEYTGITRHSRTQWF